jgi:hypothetical protein
MEYLETTVINSLARYLNSYLMLTYHPLSLRFGSLDPLQVESTILSLWSTFPIFLMLWWLMLSQAVACTWKIREWFCDWQEREGGERSSLFPLWLKQLAKNALIGRILSKNVEPKIHPKTIAEISNFFLFLCFQMQKLLAKEIKFLLQQQIPPQLPYIYSNLDIIVNVYSKRNKEKFHPMRNSALEHLKHFGKNSLMSC